MRLKDKKLQLLTLAMFILTCSGCLGSGSSSDNVGQTDIGELFTETFEGDQYLNEGDSINLLTQKVEEGTYLRLLECTLEWTDEPPRSSARTYENYPDEFTLKVTNGENLNIVQTSSNNIDNPGIMKVMVPSEVIDNQTISRPIVYTIDVTMFNAGDQYPMNYVSESSKVEDTGNSFNWKIEYTYLEKK